jgi:CheY-like chemotaxis protein
MPSEQQKALDAGADDYLTKPISQPELIKKIEQLI